MIGELTNHVWQSTVFAVVAGLMTAAFRKNRAQVRYWLWLSASFKFLLPFSLLMSLGNRLEWTPATHAMPVTSAITLSMVQMSQPFPDTLALAPSTPAARDWARHRNLRRVGVWIRVHRPGTLSRLAAHSGRGTLQHAD